MRINLHIWKFLKKLERINLEDFWNIFPKKIQINGFFEIDQIKEMLDSIQPSKIFYEEIAVNKSEQIQIVSKLAKKVTIWIKEYEKKDFKVNNSSITDVLIIKSIKSLQYAGLFPNIKNLKCEDDFSSHVVTKEINLPLLKSLEIN